MTIQSETYSPQHMSSEKEKWTRWLIATIALGIVVFCLLASISPLVYTSAHQSFNHQSAGEALNYLSNLANPDFVAHAHSWVWHQSIMTGIIVIASPFMASMFVCAIFFSACPYRNFEMTGGDVRWATDKDIRRMEARRQIGIRGGYVGILGKWTNGDYIRLIEPISIACSAPPGTGKSLRIDVPVLRFVEGGDLEVAPAGEISVGDDLVAPDGRRTTVREANTAWDEMWIVSPHGCDAWHANTDHLMPLHDSVLGRRVGRPVTIGDLHALGADATDRYLLRHPIIDLPGECDHAFTVDRSNGRTTITAFATGGVSGPLAQRQALAIRLMLETARPFNGRWWITTADEALADRVARLMSSVGFATTRSSMHAIVGMPTGLPSTSWRRLLASPPRSEVHHAFDLQRAEPGQRRGIVLDEGNREFLLADFTATHNTAALVVPSLVESPDISFIVNDPKPELAEMTSGYRAEIGNVFIIDWSATDRPDEGLFYPRFNFLSSQLVPPPGTAERDTYLDAVAKVLIPEGKGGGDKYFVDKGRDCLTGFMHYLVSHINDAKQTDTVPPQWVGYEASFPLLVDWIADAQFAAGKLAEKKNQEAAAAKQLPNADGMKIFLTQLADQVKANGYSERAFTSLSPLIDMADKERSGVLGTMDQAMLPFKNKAVKERTCDCDFTSMDLRGMKDPDTGEWLPVTLYICVNQAEAQAFANITALLYEVLSRDFLSYGPGEKDKRGRVMGPKTICFMMDEFAKLPKSETVLTGPDLGRSKKVSYWLIFQARSQIIKTYSKEDGTTIDSTCGVTILLSQNDPETAGHYIKTVGKTTIRKQSYSRNSGLSKSANPFARNESIASESVDFLRTEDITAMEPGTHLILPQNFLNRPMKVRSPFFFEDPGMLAKVFNPRTGQGPRPANPLPEPIRVARHLEWLERQTRQQDMEAIAQERAMEEMAMDVPDDEPLY